MAKYRISRTVRYKDMSEIDRVKADLTKYEFISEYIQNLIDQKLKDVGGDESKIDYQLYDLQYLAEEKARKIAKKHLDLGAFSMSYDITKNKQIFNVAQLMEKIYDYFEIHTKFSREYVRDCIDQNLMSVEIKKEFEGHSTRSWLF